MHKRTLVWLFPFVMLVLMIVGCVYSLQSTFEPPRWTLTDINRTFVGTIPADAANLAFDGHLGRGGFLQLSFEAPASSAQPFLTQLCSGQLHQGYDPFTAIDIAEPFSYAYPIQLNIYSYYSYSPNTPAFILGNRCISDGGSQLQIKVDTSNPAAYKFQLDLRFSCTMCVSLAPNMVRPSSDSPVYLLGFRSLGDRLQLLKAEGCIGLEPAFINSIMENTASSNSKLSIEINDATVATANIGKDGAILDQLYRESTIDPTIIRNPYYFCFTPQVIPNLDYTITVRITAPSGKEYQYSWDFVVRG